MQLIKKISTKTVLGKRPDVPEGDKAVFLWDLIGIANGSKHGESANGPYTGLTGQFQAINRLTGEVYRSGIAYPPAVALDMVLGQLGPEVQSVQFAFSIGVKKDGQAATGYVYVAEPLVNVSENDPLEALIGKVKHALPAPAKAEKAKAKSAA
jgi:hypothetical protein